MPSSAMHRPGRRSVAARAGRRRDRHGPRRRARARRRTEWTQRRQSPTSSRKRSTTMVRSSGTRAGGRRAGRRGSASRFAAARSSQPCGAQPRVRPPPAASTQLAHERADRPAQLERAAERVAVPERHLAGLAGRRRDDARGRAVMSSMRQLDAPSRNVVAGAGLVHHLLVELADARRARRRGRRRTARGRGSCRRW